MIKSAAWGQEGSLKRVLVCDWVGWGWGRGELVISGGLPEEAGCDEGQAKVPFSFWLVGQCPGS